MGIAICLSGSGTAIFMGENASERMQAHVAREAFADAGRALEVNEIGGELAAVAEEIREHMRNTFGYPALNR